MLEVEVGKMGAREGGGLTVCIGGVVRRKDITGDEEEIECTR